MMRMQLGECFTTLPTTSLHDLVVGVEQVVAAHSGLARNAGSDDHDVGVGGIGVIVGARDVAVALLHRHGLQQIERLALGNSLHDVDEHDIGQFLGSDPMGRGGPNISCSYNRNLLAHFLSLSTIRVRIRCYELRPMPDARSGPPLTILPCHRSCCRHVLHNCRMQIGWCAVL